jgi:hypothetical protein
MNVIFTEISSTVIILNETHPPEIDCDQTAIGLKAITSAIFLIAKQFW